jgi:hypothetical protein
MTEPVTLSSLIRDPASSIDAIGAWLDGLADDERVAQIRTLGRSDQRALYAKAEAARVMTLDDVVPPGTPARTEVIHEGRNTLPLVIPSLKLFQKRFARTEDGSARLFGYNQSPFLGPIGPGFYVAYETAGRPEWEPRGGVVVDYFQVPDGPVPDGWPKVVPNSKGLSYFVYNGTRDFLRLVSKHVSIGAAYKGEKSLGQFFMLCRRER